MTRLITHQVLKHHPYSPHLSVLRMIEANPNGGQFHNGRWISNANIANNDIPPFDELKVIYLVCFLITRIDQSQDDQNL